LKKRISIILTSKYGIITTHIQPPSVSSDKEMLTIHQTIVQAMSGVISMYLSFFRISRNHPARRYAHKLKKVYPLFYKKVEM